MTDKLVVSIDDLQARTGDELVTSDWVQITQAMIDAYADAVGDHQHIHVDPQACANRGGFMGKSVTIAHGALTSGRALGLMTQMLAVEGHYFINAGDDTVYPAAVEVDDEVRVVCRLAEYTPGKKKGGVLTLELVSFARSDAEGDGVEVAITTIKVIARPKR